MMDSVFRLKVRSGPNAGETYPLEKEEIWIGREPSNDVIIPDPEVSRRHARLVLRGGGYAIEDLGSTNGTLVNGELIAGLRLLRHGDVIELGEHTSLVFEAVEPTLDETVAVFRPEAEHMVEAMSKEEGQPTSSESILAAGEMPDSLLVEGNIESRAEVPRGKRRIPVWVWVLIILVGVLGFCGLIALFVIDALNLYCVVLPGVTNWFFPGACP
jgi:hypothetical protein